MKPSTELPSYPPPTMSTLKQVEVTREGLLKAGFVPLRYYGHDPASGTEKVLTHDQYLVHRSLADTAQYQYLNAISPQLQPFDNHWEAKHGAQWFMLRTDSQLQGFMTLFNYPFPE